MHLQLDGICHCKARNKVSEGIRVCHIHSSSKEGHVLLKHRIYGHNLTKRGDDFVGHGLNVIRIDLGIITQKIRFARASFRASGSDEPLLMAVGICAAREQ